MNTSRISTNFSIENLCSECSWIYKNEKIINNRHCPLIKSKGPRIRAGVCMYNPKEDKLLIVQVYNEFIGLPKGGQEENETLPQTALRELEEETGIKLEKLEEDKKVKFYNTCTYYMVDTDVCLPIHLKDFENNDVSGVGWVHRSCISKIPGKLTSHLEKILKRIENASTKTFTV